jgi:hypothetical protein
MSDNIQHVTVLDMKDDILKADSSGALQEFVFLIVPIKLTHTGTISSCVPYVNIGCGR